MCSQEVQSRGLQNPAGGGRWDIIRVVGLKQWRPFLAASPRHLQTGEKKRDKPIKRFIRHRYTAYNSKNTHGFKIITIIMKRALDKILSTSDCNWQKIILF